MTFVHVRLDREASAVRHQYDATTKLASLSRRVQQSQQRQANGFGAQHGTDAELPERATAPKAVFNRHNIPTDSAPGNGPGLPTPQPQVRFHSSRGLRR